METDCTFLSACSGLGGRELKRRGMSKSTLLVLWAKPGGDLMQHGGEDTGAGWKAKFDSYLHLFAWARLGRGETQDSTVWED